MFFYLNLHICLSVIALATATTHLLIGNFLQWHQSTLLASAVLISYNADKLLLIDEADKINVIQRALFFHAHRNIITVALFIVGFIFLYVVSLQAFQVIATLALLGCLSLLYFLMLRQKRRQVFAFLKPSMIAFVWSLATVVLPYVFIFKNKVNVALLILIFGERFFLFFMNALWFDFRDAQGDLATQKPNWFSSKRYVTLCQSLSIVFIFWAVFSSALALRFESLHYLAIEIVISVVYLSSAFVLMKYPKLETEKFYFLLDTLLILPFFSPYL